MNAFWRATRWARAIKFWIALGLLALGWLSGIGRAEAVDYVVDTRCGHNAPDLNNAYTKAFTYEGEAKAACYALPAVGWYYAGSVSRKFNFASCAVNTKAFKGQYAGTTTTQTNPGCVMGTGVLQNTYPWGNMTWTIAGCPPGQTWDDTVKKCMVPCSGMPPLSGGGIPVDINAPGVDPWVCHDECLYGPPGSTYKTVKIDGQTWTLTDGWTTLGDHCAVGEGDPSLGEPPDDTDGDGTSDPEDGAPNNPGSDGDPGPGDDPGDIDEDGDCGGAGQPECGTPGSGSGNGNTSGGGGDCKTPPQSSGDAILAQIAFQTWATRCAVSDMANAGGSGEPGSGGDGDVDLGTPGAVTGVPAGQSDVDGAKRFGLGLSPDMLDVENIFGEASCPALPEFSIMGYEVDVSSFTWWCTLVTIMRYCIIFVGTFAAMRILMGG